jgi:hypothetical protein
VSVLLPVRTSEYDAQIGTAYPMTARP